MIIMSVTEVKAQFSRVLNKVKSDNEIVAITRYGKTVAYLMKHEPNKRLRKKGN